MLLVDDDPINREVAKAMLVKLGHRPTVVADGHLLHRDSLAALDEWLERHATKQIPASATNHARTP